MKPQIVNIINFIRGVEPRDPNLNLLEPVLRQIEMLKEHNLPGTFLIQYDALIQKEYMEIFLRERSESIELGAWFEIVQPLVEKAGLEWRGRSGFSWDWHAHVGFSIGYTPAEREKLVDAYMKEFKDIYGEYPRSVGCWIIDAHTLKYMVDTYGIIASCNCRDQWGTDGYSLWGGYYNQAYYPSIHNVFCPAQTRENQIQVPVFRMLGSDPIYQYDAGLVQGDTYEPSWHQPVITLEPVYPEAGGNPDWVRWYFKENFNGICLSMGYTQVGQENSFGWWGMQKGLTDQMALVAEKAAAGELQVQTLEQSGRWYRSQYAQTPASAIAALTDWQNQGHKSVWYCSKQYRVNFMWENDRFWIRDIHLFDEKYKERYLTEANPHESFVYDNLPVIDGNRWSRGRIRAGIYPIRMEAADKTMLITFGEPLVTVLGDDRLQLELPVKQGGMLTIICCENSMTISMTGYDGIWSMNMQWSAEVSSAVRNTVPGAIQYSYNGFDYVVTALKGSLKQSENSILMYPDQQEILFNFQ